jgi:uncharacterized protein YecE (DUF72 family)
MCHIGTSGWVYPHWRGVFYPSDLQQSQWYKHYAKHFNTVEINYSFYRLPTEEAFNRWRKQAPAEFIYAVKANRYLTHLKRLKEVAEPLTRFLTRVERLEEKLGPILWQLPPHWRADPERIRAFANHLPKDMTHVFEFRDRRWFIPQIREILEQFELTFCIFDMPDLPCPPWITSRNVYLRFHGKEMVYGGLYGRESLKPWADRIRHWLGDNRKVYAYFNNDAFGYALEDALALQDLLAS